MREAIAMWNAAVPGEDLFAYAGMCPNDLVAPFLATGNTYRDGVTVCPLSWPHTAHVAIPIAWVPNPCLDKHVAGRTYYNSHFHPPLRTWVRISARAAFDYKGVIAHELGHVLGLAHSSNDASLMWPGSAGVTAVPMMDTLPITEILGR